MEQSFFVAIHKNDNILKHSSSGGAFTAITDVWSEKYQNNAVVYGCILDENLKAVHVRATDESGRNLMRGSKYISSDILSVFQMAENDLRDGLYVVFSGTPCQIAGLKSYLKVRKTECAEKLLTVDIICHGVGSNVFFDDYIAHLEKSRKSKAISCNFRAKSGPGKIQDMEVLFRNGKKYNASSTRYDWFYSAYNKNLILRPSCYTCKYAKKERVSDISIADSWGVDFGENGKLGSLVIANTEHGFEVLNSSLDKMEYKEITFEEICQLHLSVSATRPDNYDEFWSVYEKDGYMAAQKFIGNNTLKGRTKYFAAYVLNKFHLIEPIKKLKK